MFKKYLQINNLVGQSVGQSEVQREPFNIQCEINYKNSPWTY